VEKKSIGLDKDKYKMLHNFIYKIEVYSLFFTICMLIN